MKCCSFSLTRDTVLIRLNTSEQAPFLSCLYLLTGSQYVEVPTHIMSLCLSFLTGMCFYTVMMSVLVH